MPELSLRNRNIARKIDLEVISDSDSESSATTSPIKSIKFFAFYFKKSSFYEPFFYENVWCLDYHCLIFL